MGKDVVHFEPTSRCSLDSVNYRTSEQLISPDAVRRHLQNSLKRWNIPVLDKKRIQQELPSLFRIQYCSLDHEAAQ